MARMAKAATGTGTQKNKGQRSELLVDVDQITTMTTRLKNTIWPALVRNVGALR